MKILIIGGGNMGRTYAESFITHHTVAKENLYILEREEKRWDFFRALGFEKIYFKPGDYMHEIDLLILAIKPQDRESLYRTIAPYIKKDQLILSIMAGVTMDSIKEALPSKKIIRAMPNLPAQIGMGFTGFTSDDSVGKDELFAIQNLLNTTGKSLYFDDESKIDAVTAISGSGPAYVFYFMDAMIQKAVELGFSTNQAELMVEQTFMGAIHLLNAGGTTCKEWIAKVSSKGGTTEAAMDSFSSVELDSHIKNGLEKAYRRAIELGA
jgi:pyrroline-5-carboxylate reductase